VRSEVHRQRPVTLTCLRPICRIELWHYISLHVAAHARNCGVRLRNEILFVCCNFMLCRLWCQSTSSSDAGNPRETDSSRKPRAGSAVVLCRCLSRKLGASVFPTGPALTVNPYTAPDKTQNSAVFFYLNCSDVGVSDIRFSARFCRSSHYLHARNVTHMSSACTCGPMSSTLMRLSTVLFPR